MKKKKISESTKARRLLADDKIHRRLVEQAEGLFSKKLEQGLNDMNSVFEAPAPLERWLKKETKRIKLDS